MIKSHYFPDKTYSTKEELFADLKDNLELIIDKKRTEVYESYKKGQATNLKPIDVSKFDVEQQKALKLDDNYFYFVFNTTRILDSHEDVHIDGLWKKTIQEKQFKNYVVTDHELEVLNTVVRKEYVEIFTAKIPFSLIGKSYNGNTEALIYKFPKDKVQIPIVKEWLESGDALEGSVRMKYIKYVFCIDSNNPEDEEFKSNYDKYIDYIANKEDFEYIPYFFAVLEASNERESSVLIDASNKATGKLKENTQADESLEQKEAEQSLQIEETQKEQLKQLLSKFK